MLGYLNAKTYVALFKKKPGKPGKRCLLNKYTRQRNYPCNLRMQLYMDFKGSFDPSREVPCTNILCFHGKQAGKGRFHFCRTQNLRQKYLL